MSAAFRRGASSAPILSENFGVLGPPGP